MPIDEKEEKKIVDNTLINSDINSNTLKKQEFSYAQVVKQSLSGVSIVSINGITDQIKVAMQTDSEREKRIILHTLLTTGENDTDQQSKKKNELIKNGWSARDGFLYYFGRLYVPNNRILRSDLLVEAHDSPLSGHLGIKKTLYKLSRFYYWPHMDKEVKEYVKSCLACASIKSSNLPPAGLLHPLPIPNDRFETMTIDFITQLPITKQKQNSVLVVMVNKLTKKVKLAATHRNFRATDVAEIVWREWVREYGVPKQIISDRDPRFDSDFWKALWRLMGTKLRMSTTYHPQTDGQTENMNKTVENMLRSYVNHHLDDWDEYLISVEIAVNSAVQDSSGYSPYYLTYGQHINLPLSEAAKNTEKTEQTQNETANEFAKRMELHVKEAQRNLLAEQERQRKQANKHRREVSYKVGDMVMLETKNLSNYNSKLRPRYCGPFPITKVWSDVNVELDLPDVMEIGRRIHVEKLRLFTEDTTRFPTRRQINRPPAAFGKRNKKEYEVERIIDEKVENNVKRYLVLWKNWPISDASWEREASLTNAPELLAEWKNIQRKIEEGEQERKEKESHEHKLEIKTTEIQESKHTQAEQEEQKEEKQTLITSDPNDAEEEESEFHDQMEEDENEDEYSYGSQRYLRRSRRLRNKHSK